MSKYTMIPLSEMFDLQMGKTPSRSNPDYWENGEYKWISISDLSGSEKYIYHTKERISQTAVTESGIKLVPKDTIVMSFKLSIGKTAITTEPMYTNEAIMAFHDRKKYDLDINYVYHLFSHWNWNSGINKAAMGATLNKATLQTVAIPIPTIGKQKEIAAALDSVSEMLHLRKAQLAELDSLIKSQFIAMFGDPLENPKGWPIIGLMDMGDCKNGLNFASGESGQSIKCLGVGDFKDLSVIDGTSELPEISLNKLPSAEYLLQDEDIVFVRSNGNKALVGRCLVVYPHGTPTTYSGFCIRYRKRYENMLIPYLLQVLKAPTVRKQMAGRGANIQNLNQQMLASLNIPIPPLDLQLQFSYFLQSVDKSRFTLMHALYETHRLYDSLMAEYFEA